MIHITVLYTNITVFEYYYYLKYIIYVNLDIKKYLLLIFRLKQKSYLNVTKIINS